MALQTEYKFTLPKGFVDEDGNLHQNGVMRLATAADEILPQRDPRVQSNPAYLTLILLSRVVLKLGNVTNIDPTIMEELFLEDLAYLQELYQRINGNGEITLKTKCQNCGEEVEVTFSPQQ